MPAARMGPTLRVFWRVHRAFMRLTGGRFGRVGAMDALLLTTKGRKSGERRDVALNYLGDGGAYVVVASYVGEDRDPAWWLNLQSEPEAEVAVAGKRLKVRARVVDGVERERLWARFVEKDPAYGEYQQRTTRRLPVVALEPRFLREVPEER
jgi:F420H(2)-dependent quinone reductase